MEFHIQKPFLFQNNQRQTVFRSKISSFTKNFSDFFLKKMCSVLKKFINDSTRNSSLVQVSAHFYVRETDDGQFIKRKKLRSIMLTQNFNCVETVDSVDISFRGIDEKGVVDVSVFLPFANGREFPFTKGRELRYIHESTETVITNARDPFLCFVAKVRKNELAMFTGDKQRTQGDERFSDFALEYEEKYWTMEKEVATEMAEGKHKEWLRNK